MYSIVIADDEYISREGLAKFVSGLGYNVLATFKDGSNLIEFLKNNKADIIITDIRMNDVDGLEVAKYVYENHLKTKVIIMSGYKIFDYAKKAIEYNAVEYLLKPVRMDDISNLLEKTCNQLDEERNIELRQNAERKRYETLFPVIAEQFFSDVANGVINENDLEKYFLKITEFYCNRKCGIVFFEYVKLNEYLLNKWHYNSERFNLTIKNMLIDKNEYFETHYVIQDDSQIIIIAVSKNSLSQEEFKKELEMHFKSLTDCIMQLMDFELIVKEIYIYNDINDALKSLYNISRDNNLESDEIISSINTCTSDSEGISELIIEKAKVYIEKNYMDDVNLAEIANQVHLSPTYFSRFFKLHSGETLTDYIVKKRIEKAIEMLIEGKTKVYEVSQKVGYRDSKYFYKIFKKYTGYTPKEYYFRSTTNFRGNTHEK